MRGSSSRATFDLASPASLCCTFSSGSSTCTRGSRSASSGCRGVTDCSSPNPSRVIPRSVTRWRYAHAIERLAEVTVPARARVAAGGAAGAGASLQPHGGHRCTGDRRGIHRAGESGAGTARRSRPAAGRTLRHATAAGDDRPWRRDARPAAGVVRCASRAPAWVREAVRRADPLAGGRRHLHGSRRWRRRSQSAGGARSGDCRDGRSCVRRGWRPAQGPSERCLRGASISTCPSKTAEMPGHGSWCVRGKSSSRWSFCTRSLPRCPTHRSRRLCQTACRPAQGRLGG